MRNETPSASMSGQTTKCSLIHFNHCCTRIIYRFGYLLYSLPLSLPSTHPLAYVCDAALFLLFVYIRIFGVCDRRLVSHSSSGPYLTPEHEVDMILICLLCDHPFIILLLNVFFFLHGLSLLIIHLRTIVCHH